MGSKEQTSRRMGAVRHTSTAAEIKLRRALWHAGIRGYRTNLRSVRGAPDVVFTKHRLAVFVDGAFWHGHPNKFPEARMSEYWKAKIARNRIRDERVVYELQMTGWRVLRFWDFEVDHNLIFVLSQIRNALGLAESS
jgi:DNA mismatch endonuclease (patch repair protein)